MRTMLKFLGYTGYLDDDEKIEFVVRQKFAFTFPKILTWLLLGFGVAGGGYYLYPQLWMVWVIVIAFGLIRALRHFLQWYYTGLLVTNAHVLCIQWNAYFNTKTTDIDYTDLDEIEVEKIGVGAFFYNYGKLILVKVGEGEYYRLDRVPSPHKVARRLEAYREKMIHVSNFSQDSSLKKLLGEMLERHVDTHGLDESIPQIKHKSEKKITDEPKPVKKETKKKHHFTEDNVMIEKELDDTGGIEIDLDETD